MSLNVRVSPRLAGLAIVASTPAGAWLASQTFIRRKVRSCGHGGAMSVITSCAWAASQDWDTTLPGGVSLQFRNHHFRAAFQRFHRKYQSFRHQNRASPGQSQQMFTNCPTMVHALWRQKCLRDHFQQSCQHLQHFLRAPSSRQNGHRTPAPAPYQNQHQPCQHFHRS